MSEPPARAHEEPRRRPRIGKVGRGEPTLRCADPPPPALRQGIAEFNSGLFFEQHETLEAAWIDEEDPVRYLYQGILQIGVGFHHLSRGNAYGARRMWQKGVLLLAHFQGGCMNVDVDRLRRETEQCLAELERVGEGSVAAFERTLIPRIHWLRPAEVGE